MIRLALAFAVLVILTYVSPSLARGHHIECKLTAVITKKSAAQQDIDRTLRFYLDDTGETLVSETSDLGVKTKMYSDTQIEAQIFDVGLLSPNPLFAIFGNIASEPASLTINRTNGKVSIVANLFVGSDLEIGDCVEVAPAPTKF